jgi:hypothetical protein
MPSLGLDLGTIVDASVPLGMITRRMISPRPVVYSSAALILLVISAASQEKEKKIKRSDLPAAVQATVTAQSRGATVRGFAEEKENGQTFYEAQLKVSGHSKDVLMDPLGNIVEVEEEVALGALPAAVKEGLLAQTASSKLVKVESLTKQGKLVAYEGQLITKGKKSDIQVGPDGKLLDHQE